MAGAVTGEGDGATQRPPFELTVHRNDDRSARLVVAGELDGSTAPRLHAGLAEVSPATAAARCARQLVAALLPMWDLEHLPSDTQLIVTELVTNAYQHAPSSDSFELQILDSP